MAELETLKSKFLGGMIGSAVGDAIGEMAFRCRSESELRRRVTQSERLIYTDDTVMAVGLAQSLLEVGTVDRQHLGDTFRANYRREPWRGYASGPPTIFALVERRSIPYPEAAKSLFGGQGSFGNGAAMRIAPLGLFFYDSQLLYEHARASASVTHAHPIGADGAAVLARAVAHAVRLVPSEPFPLERFCRGLIEFARTLEMRGKMKLVRTLIAEGTPPPVAADRLGRSVAVHESLPFAVYAFLRHPTSFAECLFCATLHGGDRDTLGAMACAISGAHVGVEAIPADWRAKLENQLQIEHLARRLAEMKLGQ